MEPVATNFPALSAPVSILLFLGTVALLLLCLTGAAIVALAGWRRTARRLVLSAAGLTVLYATALFATGFAARERTVRPGTGKTFCEIDCHLVYTAASARLEELSPGRRLAKIRLTARFDERTISPTRGNAPLTPNPREVVLVDAAGRLFVPLSRDPALSRALRPGESATAELSFEIPRDATGLRLLVTESDWPTRLLIGHENAPLCGKTYLALPG
ncbi:MAG TPA: hypothetical protein VF425_02695 [Thermoanaerobaculia bacterium]